MSNYPDSPGFVAGSTTSEAAAKSLENPSTLRAKVYRFLLNAGEGGATDEEMQDRLSMNANTQRPRRRELVLQNRVTASKYLRKTRAGRDATVWHAK